MTKVSMISSGRKCFFLIFVLLATQALDFVFAAATKVKSPTTSNLQQQKAGRIRGSKKNKLADDQVEVTARHRALKKGHHHHSSYLGCLNYTSDELQDAWIFHDDPPDCSYVHYSNSTSSNNGGDGESSSGGGSSSSGGGSSSSGGGSSSSGGEDDEDYGEDGDGEVEDRTGDGDNNGEGGGNEDSDNDGRNGNGEGDENGDGNENGNGNGNGNGSGNGDSYVEVDGDYEDNVVVSYGNGEPNPIEDFDITQCSTYENLWLWDLSFTCSDEYNLDDCECTFTKELMDDGLLTCDDIVLCPDDCRVCDTCLELQGCAPNPDKVSLDDRVTQNASFYVIAGAIGMFVFGTAYYYTSRYRNKKDPAPLDADMSTVSPLNTHMIDSNENAAQHDVEAISPGKYIPPTENDSQTATYTTMTTITTMTLNGNDDETDANSSDDDIYTEKEQKGEEDNATKSETNDQWSLEQMSSARTPTSDQMLSGQNGAESASPENNAANDEWSYEQSTITENNAANDEWSLAQSTIPENTAVNDEWSLAQSAIPENTAANDEWSLAQSTIPENNAANDEWSLAQSTIPENTAANDEWSLEQSTIPDNNTVNDEWSLERGIAPTINPEKPVANYEGPSLEEQEEEEEGTIPPITSSGKATESGEGEMEQPAVPSTNRASSSGAGAIVETVQEECGPLPVTGNVVTEEIVSPTSAAAEPKVWLSPTTPSSNIKQAEDYPDSSTEDASINTGDVSEKQEGLWLAPVDSK